MVCCGRRAVARGELFHDWRSGLPRPSSAPEPAEPPEIMKAQEVADYLRVSYVTVLRMTRAGRINAIRVGREFRYLRSEVEKALRTVADPPSDE